MASITINAQDVIEACDELIAFLLYQDKLDKEREQNKPLTTGYQSRGHGIIETKVFNNRYDARQKAGLLKKFCQFSVDRGLLSITIDQNDFELIGEYLK